MSDIFVSPDDYSGSEAELERLLFDGIVAKPNNSLTLEVNV